MPYADPVRIRDRVVDIMNAAATFGGAIVTGTRSEAAIAGARVEAGMQVLKALARSGGVNGYYQSLTTAVPVLHNAFLPAHDGAPGIPIIVPFNGAAEREGRPATPDEIDAWRSDTDPGVESVYTLVDGVAVPHDQKDARGKMSPVACRYSLVQRFKFTGLTAKVPLVQLTRAMADTGVPEAFEDTVIKLMPPMLCKVGDALYTIAAGYGKLGAEDLPAIEAGAMSVKPVPAVEALQRTLL